MDKPKKKRRKYKGIVYNRHHPDDVNFPEWTIRIRRNHHQFIWRQIQRLLPTEINLKDIENLRDSLNYEILRRQRILKAKDILEGKNNEKTNDIRTSKK